MGFWSDIRDSVAGRVVLGVATGGLSEAGRSISENADKTARAQQAAAEAQKSQAQRDREQMLGFAAASPSELATQKQALELQNQIFGRTNRELEFLQKGLDMKSPGAAEAGQGLFSSILLRKMDQEEAEMDTVMRGRFGPNWRSTSAGIAAMTQFQQSKSDRLVSAIPQFLQTAYGAMQATTSLENVLKNRSMAAMQATPLTPFAGAEQVGTIQRGMQQQQMTGSLIQLGGTVLGAVAGGPAGAAAGGKIAGGFNGNLNLGSTISGWGDSLSNWWSDWSNGPASSGASYSGSLSQQGSRMTSGGF